MVEDINSIVAMSLEELHATVPAAAELDQEAVLDVGESVLDVFGVEYADLGQQRLATACGTGQSNGVDLDGE